VGPESGHCSGDPLFQDQQIAVVFPRGCLQRSTANYVHEIADWCSSAQHITPKQREKIEQIIADRPGWAAALPAVCDGRYIIHVCPCAVDQDEFEAVAAQCPAGMDGRVTVGLLNERTWDGDDPCRSRKNYVTIVWRLVAEARTRGLIIGEDGAPPAYEPISCYRHRQFPDWRRDPAEAFEAAGVDARVTPEPLRMLLAMRDGAVLRERYGDWFEYRLHKPDGSRGPPVMTRAMNRLLALAFIERIGQACLDSNKPRSCHERE
jgi:hypothetical protein